MSDKAKLQLLVLWEDEVRTAAAALRRLWDALEALDEEARAALLSDALRACYVALDGADDSSRAVVLSSKPPKPRRRRQRPALPAATESQQ